MRGRVRRTFTAPQDPSLWKMFRIQGSVSGAPPVSGNCSQRNSLPARKLSLQPSRRYAPQNEGKPHEDRHNARDKYRNELR